MRTANAECIDPARGVVVGVKELTTQQLYRYATAPYPASHAEVTHDRTIEVTWPE
ncbi:hypothetical protein P3T23_006761 [Paraburkholderia sp. GAS448]